MQTLKLTKKYEKYPEYKDSGVEWLGKIPKDWKYKKLKSFFSLSNERVIDNPEVTTILSVSGYRGVEIRKNIETFDGQMPSENIGAYRVVRKNQLVANTMWLNFAGIGVSKYEGYVSPAYRAYNISKEMVPEYVNHLMRSDAYVQKYSSLLYGLRPNSLQVKPYDFEKIEILYPDINEQKRISKYLDEKTSSIDQIIEKKQKLIEFLVEKRTVVINDAVTKGLNKNTEFVNSGIEWIGKIPKGWKIKRLKDISSYCSRGGSPEYTEDENAHKFINQSCVRDGFLDLEKIKFSSTESKKGLIKNGDVLINSTGTGTLGRLTVFDGNNTYFADTHVAIYRPKENIHSRFLMYVIQHPAWQNYLYASCVTGSTNQIELSRNNFLEIPVLIPDLNEQIEVAAYLDKKTSLFNQSIKEIEKSIELLQEFKSSLISNVVTGKIKI